jgi:soluble lytic murein transglycosylase
MTDVILCSVILSLGWANPDAACDNMRTVVEESEKNNLDPSLVVALIYVESMFSHKAVSKSNACGLTQVLPKYSKKFADKGRNLTCDELKDPTTSIKVGTKILNYWVYKYARGNIATALCGYNAGFRCKGENKNKKGVSYSKKVLKYQRIIKRRYKKILKALPILFNVCD